MNAIYTLIESVAEYTEAIIEATARIARRNANTGETFDTLYTQDLDRLHVAIYEAEEVGIDYEDAIEIAAIEYSWSMHYLGHPQYDYAMSEMIIRELVS